MKQGLFKHFTKCLFLISFLFLFCVLGFCCFNSNVSCFASPILHCKKEEKRTVKDLKFAQAFSHILQVSKRSLVLVTNVECEPSQDSNAKPSSRGCHASYFMRFGDISWCPTHCGLSSYVAVN